MYYIYGISGPSLHIESTDSMITAIFTLFDRCFISIIIGDSDFHLDADAVIVMPTGDAGVDIVFESNDDSNEMDETLILTLVPKPFTLQTFPRGEAVFFMNAINLTILDHKGIVYSNCL